MKKTYRDEWRVLVTLKPQRPADLGLTGLDDLAEFIAVGKPITVTVLPRSLGDFGFASVSDRLASRDVDGDYRRRCDEIAAELRARPHITEVTVTCTETHTCSYCGCGWEVLTADEAAGRAYGQQDEHSVEGEPVCCGKAIDEFRAERSIPLLAEGVVAYRHPSRPGVLLCREHGYGWAGLTPLSSDDLPDGGTCTYGRPSVAECGRDVLIGGAA
ncbi:hypothetical protein [Streptomyces chryseus]|uniref:hypothetical protein n=1 Tax=Streptomyces chryseus TaxID=68186 RepID=UPI00167713A4|nr:hypothetical protein [Streptomyces chryseus]GGX02242.1 hypothetical protein GCM10010353_17440 [Streptomyces chryseus]